MNTRASNRPDVPPGSVTDVNDPRSAESIPALIRDLANDVSTLMEKELALAKAEVREAADSVKTGIASLSTGAGIAFAGLIILLLSAVYALSEIMETWLAALIVGGSALIIGFILVKSAQNKLRSASLAPNRTMQSLHKDKETAKGAIK